MTASQNFLFNKKFSKKQLCLIHLVKILAYKKYSLNKIKKIKYFDPLAQPNPNRLQSSWFGLGFIFFLTKPTQTNLLKFDWVGSWVCPNPTQIDPLTPLRAA